MVSIGMGAGPAGLVLARPLFGNLMKFIINIIAHASRAPNATYYSRATSKVFPTPWSVILDILMTLISYK